LLLVLPEEETYLALFHGARRVAADCDGQEPRMSVRRLRAGSILLPSTGGCGVGRPYAIDESKLYVVANLFKSRRRLETRTSFSVISSTSP
jgi:hypothetical protein